MAKPHDQRTERDAHPAPSPYTREKPAIDPRDRDLGENFEGGIEGGMQEDQGGLGGHTGRNLPAGRGK
ncbi:MAG TPA: hypothetical protein P5572_06675 [Phycisphaerae bacterium]|nr:hypothetical protein [Phycisphaerales bacterium]HRX84689.1 hypothetical protein [Phycisphaerae bacterium]